jgi:hypothetical protein
MLRTSANILNKIVSTIVEEPLLKICPKTSLKIKTIKNNVRVRLVINVASTGKIVPGLSHQRIVNSDTISN